jgi:GTP pyrophosphokinase
MAPDEIDLVVKAYQLAVESAGDVRGTSSCSLPPLDSALVVATILAQMMHVDAIGIAAGLVFEAVDAELLLPEQVEYALGGTVAHVIESMLSLNILERKKLKATTGAMQAVQKKQLSSTKKEREEDACRAGSKKPRLREALRRQQSETVRKMLVAMADDPRVVLLKLAYRLFAMRQLCHPGSPQTEGQTEQDILLVAEELREIYAPLAGRLGMVRVESEMQDLAFQVLEPEHYTWVCSLLEREAKQWSSYVDRVCEILRSEMGLLGLRAAISGRVKHPYSFYKKILRNVGTIEAFEQLKKAADVHPVHDVLAFRILVETTTDCYATLGHIHSLWPPKEGRFKDFIANPKPNGYRALHTTVFCLNDQLAEIQIRTQEMHKMAEYGVAMHWHYKDRGDTASASAKELQFWLRQLTEWQQHFPLSHVNNAECAAVATNALLDEQIFVLTLEGEVKDLPVGSTPVDFAYRLHSDVGDHCAGARLFSEADGSQHLLSRIVPLDYELTNGEIIEIITSRHAHPTRDWLSFVRTDLARNKIRRYLKTKEDFAKE